MSNRTKAPPRSWQFWRRAFWTRPALLVFYGLLAGVVGLFLSAAVPDGILDAVEMRRAVECSTSAVRVEADVDPPRNCLERIAVTLSGPWYSRGPGSDWHLLIQREHQSAAYAVAEVPTLGSRRLTDGAEADALLWEGTPVAIELPAGGRVETRAWGHRGWLLSLLVGMFAAAGLPILLDAARVKRRTAGGWWSVRGEKVDRTVSSPLIAIAGLLAALSLPAVISLGLGLSLQWVVVIAVLGTGLVVYAIAKGASAGRRRPADKS